MTAVPAPVIIVVETLIGIFLLFFLWFTISVLREVARRLRIVRWAMSHPSLIRDEERRQRK